MTLRSLKQFRELWRRLTEPDASIRDASERIGAWFLGSVFLMIALTIGTILPVLYLLTGASNAPQRILATLFASAGLLGGYVLVRRGHTVLAGYLTLICGSVVIIGTTLWLDDVTRVRTLNYSVIMILFASLFVSLRVTLLVSAFYIISMLIIPSINPLISSQAIAQGPLRFVILMTLIAVIFAYYRVRLEHERRREVIESEQRYRLVSDLIANYAFSFRIEPDGRAVYEWMTDGFARITGYQWAELEAIGTQKLYHPDDLPRRTADLARLYEGEPLKAEYRIYTKSGDLRWLHVTSYAARDDHHGWVNRCYGVAQDITERKQAEAQQLQATVQRERFKLMSDFVMAVSHDFRTALATISTSRYLLERQMAESDRPRLQGRLDVIQHSIDHMAQQINNLQTISALNNLKRVAYDLQQLLESVINEHAPAARQRQQTLELESTRHPLLIQADPHELRRAFSEVIRNAVNYTPPEGRITITLHNTQQTAHIIVRDTGIGIPAEHLPHIFDFFYRADSARSINSGGVGLGLSIARLIIEAHGGEIEVQSISNEGSSVTISLPLEPEPIVSGAF